jgi:cyclopropane-fatty-acyl-phospholipid synthase
MMKLGQFRYKLPEELIAQQPAKHRDESRLMVVHKRSGKIEHKMFKDVLDYFEEGDVMGLVSLLRANNAWDKGGDLGRPSALKRLVNRAGFAAEQINNRVGSKNNVAHHYDIGNPLYALMLDTEHWQYSCAYWPEGVTTLAQAQGAKLAHIARKLALLPGQEVLDIGCGWGETV